MMKGLFFALFLGTACVANAQTQTQLTAEDYIALYHEAAVINMVQHKVPASITLAQGLFESGFGNSPLAVNANNHFGIKCHEWTGDTYYHDDDAPQECFRKYANVQDSYADHAQFLKTRSRYSKCFLLELTDYKGWARELKAAGYATLPSYPEKIVGLIERFHLDQYDREALALMGKNSVDTVPSPEKKPEAVTQTPEKKPEPEKQPERQPERKAPKPAESTERVVVVEKQTERAPASSKRQVAENNGIPFVVSRAGDTQSSLADEFELAEWQIRRYNELAPNAPIVPGTRIYLAPKKDQNSQIDAHVVTEGESLEQIAQLHGIRKEALMEMNGLTVEILSVGQTLKLH